MESHHERGSHIFSDPWRKSCVYNIQPSWLLSSYRVSHFFCKVLDQHWIKFRFLDPDCNFIWFLSQRFGFWISIRFLNQFLIFESSFDFWIKFWILNQVLIFVSELKFLIFNLTPKLIESKSNLIPSSFWSKKKNGNRKHS